METWGDAVLRLALNQLRNTADAEDVFQDVFLRLLGSNVEFRGPEHMKAWLLRVTLNRCRDHQRQRQRRRTEPCADMETVVAVADDAGLLGSEVWEAVGLLPADLRAVVHLFYVEGYSTAEIGRLVGCEAATVRTRLHRARRMLKETLETRHSSAACACASVVQEAR